MIKKIIRGIIKVPATPFVLLLFVFWYMTISISQAYDWLYEIGDEWDRQWNLKSKRNAVEFIKKWFTAV